MALLKMITSISVVKPAAGCSSSSRSSGFVGARVAGRKQHKARVSVSRRTLQTSAQVGLFFATTTGHTEEVADAIKAQLGEAVSAPIDISDAGADALGGYDALIVGAPTWNTGADVQRSGTEWDEVVGTVSGMSLAGKKVAVFGCGDSVSYSDYFCDAIEEVYTAFKEAGADMVGHWPTSSYEFECSKSVVGGEPLSSDEADKMLGLAIDEENQADLTEDRVAEWSAQLKQEMSL